MSKNLYMVYTCQKCNREERTEAKLIPEKYSYIPTLSGGGMPSGWKRVENDDMFYFCKRCWETSGLAG